MAAQVDYLLGGSLVLAAWGEPRSTLDSETAANARRRDRLSRATHSEGRGAFRRFKDIQLEAPAQRERWFAFSDARQRERALEWLRSDGIEPDG